MRNEWLIRNRVRQDELDQVLRDLQSRHYRIIAMPTEGKDDTGVYRLTIHAQRLSKLRRRWELRHQGESRSLLVSANPSKPLLANLASC